MISSEHQLRIARDRIDRFSLTLRKLNSENNPNALTIARVSAIEDQISALRDEIVEYETLRSGSVKEINISSLLDLPEALVKARIARALTQTDLAELVGVKPQQVQRWEADGYRKTSLERLAQVSAALGLTIAKHIKLSGDVPFTVAQIRKALTSAGFPRDVVDDRLLPTGVDDYEQSSALDEIDRRLRLMIGRDTNSLLTQSTPLQSSQLAFKLPKSAEQVRTRAYAHYVSGLCRIVAKTIPPQQKLPADWDEVHEVFFSRGISLEDAARTCWRLGVPIIPLSDSIAFHGACWREAGKSVIALKQNSPDEARWLVDLMHEYFHAANPSTEDDFFLVEADEASNERRESLDERRAQRFATEAITNGKTEEITTLIFNQARGFGPALRNATKDVAASYELPVGLVANLMAHRLADNGFGWWGVAANLQERNEAPWKTIRRVFLECINLKDLDRVERDLVLQAVET